MPDDELIATRRVVTGHDEQGRSTVLFDGPTIASGGPAQVWTTLSSPADLTGTEDAALRPIRLEAPPGGSMFWIVRMAPISGLDAAAAAAKRDRLRMQGARLREHGRPDMHATRTLDYVVVLSGEVTLILDDREVGLRSYDCVVQRGTAHSWENRGFEPAVLAFVLLDAEML